MGQDEFKLFFSAALDVIVSEVIPKLDKDELIKEVEDMVGFNFSEIWRKTDE
jgi:hypothetical protein